MSIWLLKRGVFCYLVGVGIVGVSQRVNRLVPVQGLIHDLQHADVAVFVLGVDDVGDPLEPLYGTAIVVVVIESDRGSVLAGEGLVGLLGTRGTVKTT